MTEDLWPESIDEIPIVTTPASVLREQAEALGARTGHAILGEVDSRTQSIGHAFHHTFYFRVPSLQNYRYELLELAHDIQLYPVTVEAFGIVYRVSDEAELKDVLRRVFSSPKCLSVLKGLFSQVAT